MLSPVKADSSTEAFPLKIMPSTGIDCPDFTTIMSLIFTSAMGTSTSSPSRIIVAVCGAKLMSFVKASEVRLFDLASKYFPKVIKVRMVAPDSK